MSQKKLHDRQSIRLKGYDYSSPGYYFITICAQNMEHIFGEVIDGKMILNDFAEIARNEWLRTKSIRDNVCLYAFVIMPNHVHGIIEIFDAKKQPVLLTMIRYIEQNLNRHQII